MANPTRKEIIDYLMTFERFRQPEVRTYLGTAIDRFMHTLSLIPRLPDASKVRVLEIGGVPYLFTSILKKFFGYQVDVANEPTYDRGKSNVDTVEGDNETVTIPYKAFNIEYDPWPYDDGAFDIVLYCEVIEHLVYDPTHTLVEAHRVLKKDTGTLLVSTPNALSYTSLIHMIRGKNFFPPYVGYSHYARHHRLFTPRELGYLCERVGFEISRCYSAYDSAYEHPRRLDRLVKFLIKRGRLSNRLDVIYVLGRPVGEAKYVYPDGEPFPIYTDTHAYPRRALRRYVRMSDEETSQLAGGWFPLEHWGGGVRWISERARLTLARGSDDHKMTMVFFTGPESRGPVRGSVRFTGADEHAIGTSVGFTAAPGAWETVIVDVPEGADDTIGVHIHIETPFSPAEHDRSSIDDRRLGVAMKEIGFAG
jgi:2-polyprenyl-3-methyl-5-hydroxy-6-metoxy-1,4-benzoquinol methylase